MFIYQCRDTARQLFTNNFNIQHLHALKIPHMWNPPVYGAKPQYIEAQEDIPLLPQKDVTRIQQVAGNVLYYMRVVDPTLILPVDVLASEQTQATTTTADKVIKLLN
jgi:hypothetical protein